MTVTKNIKMIAAALALATMTLSVGTAYAAPAKAPSQAEQNWMDRASQVNDGATG